MRRGSSRWATCRSLGTREVPRPYLEEEDEIDRIPADAHLDVLALIEDEVLLGLPLSPRHEFGVCEAAAGNAPAGEQHPFAVLRKLKNQ